MYQLLTKVLFGCRIPFLQPLIQIQKSSSLANKVFFHEIQWLSSSLARRSICHKSKLQYSEYFREKEEDDITDFDVAIVGAGPSGLATGRDGYTVIAHT